MTAGIWKAGVEKMCQRSRKDLSHKLFLTPNRQQDELNLLQFQQVKLLHIRKHSDNRDHTARKKINLCVKKVIPCTLIGHKR